MPFRRLLPLALGAVALLAVACGGGSSDPADDVKPASLNGAIPGCEPGQCDVPNVTLRTTGGENYNLKSAARDKILILYFGYTNCPKECPTTMADLATALRHSPQWVQDGVEVAFVTTDPKRDKPPVLRSWLDNFNPAFVGLTGSPYLIAQAENDSNIPLAEQVPAKPKDKVGKYSINHFAAALAYDHSGKVAVLYPYGISPDDIAKDLPLLVADKVKA